MVFCDEDAGVFTAGAGSWALWKGATKGETFGGDLRRPESGRVVIGPETAHIGTKRPFPKMFQRSGFDRSRQSAFVRPSHFIASERDECWVVGLAFRFAQSELVWLGNASLVESSLGG